MHSSYEREPHVACVRVERWRYEETEENMFGGGAVERLDAGLVAAHHGVVEGRQAVPVPRCTSPPNCVSSAIFVYLIYIYDL
jgi:hypothetical protein